MEKQTMGKFIAALRKANGMTQTDLADKLGVTNKSVSKWECDEGYPDLSLIPVIAEVFSVTTDEILKGSRIAKSGAGTAPETVKTEKQVNRLVQKTLTKFKNNSLIAALSEVLGIVFLVIPLMILSTAGVMDTRLFYMCLIFYIVFVIASAVMEIIFFNSAKLALYDSDVGEEYVPLLLRAQKSIEDMAFHIIIIAVMALISGLPALISSMKSIFLVLPSVYITAIIVKSVVTTKKYYDFDEQPDVKKKLRKFRNICAVVVAASLAVPFVIYVIL